MVENKQTPSKKTENTSGIEPNIASMISYIGGFVTGIVFLLLEKDNKEVKFHAWQSIFLSVAAIVYFIVTFILAWIPFLGFLIFIINILVCLGLLALVIVCAVKAYMGERFLLPVISDWAEQQASK